MPLPGPAALNTSPTVPPHEPAWPALPVQAHEAPAPSGRLQRYLQGEGPCVPVDCQSLGEGARALIAEARDRAGWTSGVRSNAFALAPDDDLPARVEWFYRLLCLLPAEERDAWMRTQVLRAEAHAMAGSPLRKRLDPLLFDGSMSPVVRCRLWSVWLATIGPGPIVLDPGRRNARLADAEALVAQALSPPPGG